MSEDVARALGARDPNPIMIAGKECQIRPLSLVELTEVERECLKVYRRAYLEAFKENADLLPDGEGAALLKRELMQSAKWDVSDLPSKDAVDPDSISLSTSLEAWVSENLQYEPDANLGKTSRARQMRHLVATAIDGGQLDLALYESLTDSKVKKSKVGYVNWWITGTFDGMLTMVWSAFRHYGVTKEEVGREVGTNPALLASLAREIEHLSAPATGNG